RHFDMGRAARWCVHRTGAYPAAASVSRAIDCDLLCRRCVFHDRTRPDDALGYPTPVWSSIGFLLILSGKSVDSRIELARPRKGRAEAKQAKLSPHSRNRETVDRVETETFALVWAKLRKGGKPCRQMTVARTIVLRR